MHKRIYTTEGIVLDKRDYSEADRIMVIYTKDFGRVSYIAKGVRKLKSRKRGSLEVFNHLKFTAARGRTWDIITETELIESFGIIRKDLKKISLAYYFSEVMEKITREDEGNLILFDIYLDYLNRLQKEDKLKSLRKEFIFEVVVELGFWPKGKELKDPDGLLRSILEKDISSVRVGKRVLE